MRLIYREMQAPRVICLGLALTWIFGSNLNAETEHPAQVAGIYEGAIAVKNSDARKITLRLDQDGTAEFVDSRTRSPAHWKVAGQQLQVDVEGRNAAMLWQIKGTSLILKSEERAAYGKKGLTLRRPR